MNDTDIKILSEQDEKTLASWWSTLNRWEWPDKLLNPEPNEYIKNGRRGEIMSFILSKIGLKECLRDWNKDRMTDDHFETWWNNNKSGM